jgi:uncharacterized RDD family membrane protein YckC
MPYASVWRRAVAVILDTFIIATLTGPIWLNSGLFSTATRANATGTVTEIIPFVASPWTGLLVAAIPFIYFTLLEGFFGATAGKMLLGLRVVQLDGSAITWREAIVRNLLRPIDEIVLYLVGAISIWSSPRNQRLGDRAADTVVVRLAPLPAAMPTAMPMAPGATGVGEMGERPDLQRPPAPPIAPTPGGRP